MTGNETTETALVPSRKGSVATMDDNAFSMLFNVRQFEHMQRVAKVFSASDLVPTHFQNNDANVMIALQMASRLQTDPLMLMQSMYVVHGRPGLEAKMQIALANQRGPFSGRIQWRSEGEGPSRKMTAYATLAGNGEICEAECSMDMAKKEGWLDKSGSKWKTLPDLMLKYRSAAFLIRLYCPEVVMGMPTSEETRDLAPIAVLAEVASVDLDDVTPAEPKPPKQKAKNPDPPTTKEPEPVPEPPPAPDAGSIPLDVLNGLEGAEECATLLRKVWDLAMKCSWTGTGFVKKYEIETGNDKTPAEALMAMKKTLEKA